MIKIVTDIEASLPPDLMKRFDVRTMPLWIHFGEDSYQEGVNITREEFYDRLANEFPKTSQASVGQFVELYRPIVEAGHEIVSIHLSSGLSGTYASAVGAAQELAEEGAKISVVDSRQASVAQSLMVWRACEWAEQGLSREEIVARLKPMSKHLRIFFMVDTLEYLRHGGRIGGAAALLGTLLQVKPILTLKDGLIDAYEKARTRKRGLVRLEELVIEAAEGNTGVDLGVVHAQCPDAAESLAEKLSETLKPKRVIVDLLGPGIGAHTGPGLVGAGIYCDEWNDRP